MPELLQSTTTPRSRNAKVRVVELADRQWGVVKRSQLEEIGLSPGGVTRWVQEGRLHRVHPHVYAVGHSALGIEGRLAAALFYAGPGAALSHVTGGSWLGLVNAVPRRIHLVAPRRCLSLPDVRVHHRSDRERIFRAALECHRPELARTKSILEEKFVLLCERGYLLLPELNVWVAGHLVDAVWFDQKIVVELDGHAGARHAHRDGWRYPE